jgi:hypothetical protein
LTEVELPPSCEASFANFGRSDTTRFDFHINFGPIDPNGSQDITNSNWNLGFVNDTRFNVLPGDAITSDIRRFPFSARWAGEIAPPAGEGELRITYVGEGSVTLSSGLVDLPPSYLRPATNSIPISPDTTSFSLEFAFDPKKSALDIAESAPYAALKVESRTSPASEWKLLESRPLSDFAKAGGLILDLYFLALVVSFILAGRNLRSSRLDPILFHSLLIAAAGYSAIRVASDTTLSLWLFALPFAAVLSFGLRARPEISRLVFLALAVTVAFVVAQRLFPTWTYVDFKTRGDDWLTYEHFARQILINRSLEGGEEVFYYQPGFRYILFAIHLALGDGAAGVAFALTLALTGSLFFFLWRIRDRLSQHLPQRSWPLMSAFGCAGLLLVLSPSIIRLMSWHASEIPAWAMMVLAFALLASRPTAKRLAAISFCAGAMFVIRPNQLFASLILVIVSLAVSYRRHPSKTHLFHGIWPFVLTASLPLLHNLYFGGSFKVLPTGSETVRDLSLGQAFFFPWTDPAREVLFEKFTRFFNPTMLTGAQGELTARLIILIWPLFIFGALWILGLRSSANRSLSRWISLGALSVPIGFLPTMILYDVDIYYPRHVIAFVLSLGLSGMTALVLAVEADIPPAGDDSRTEPIRPSRRND